MRRTSGQKPMSIIRSASSSTNVSTLVEVDGAAALVIHQPPGRGDDDVDAGLERALLRAHLDAAVDGDARERRVIREALDVVFDLHRRARASARGSGRAWSRCSSGRSRARFQHAVQDRQHEGDGLAGAGVGAADHVVRRPSAIGMTALWIGVVLSKPRTATPSRSDGSRPSVSNVDGRGIVDRPAADRSPAARGARASTPARSRPLTAGRAPPPPRLRRRGRRGLSCVGIQCCFSERGR